uniref:Uncharacterized protein n=1 Tax=Lepeophtheirus salmonis TaxID=72036 RepID=A0A0K2UAR3_LEPSM
MESVRNGLSEEMLQENNVPNVDQLEPTQQETISIRDSNLPYCYCQILSLRIG